MIVVDAKYVEDDVCVWVMYMKLMIKVDIDHVCDVDEVDD